MKHEITSLKRCNKEKSAREEDESLKRLEMKLKIEMRLRIREKKHTRKQDLEA